MITVNDTDYTSKKIVLPHFLEGDIIELNSDASSVVWKILKYPTNQNSTEAFFLISRINPSTYNHERITLELMGTYQIQCIERDANGNYNETMLYIRSNNIITHSSLPFSGEREELDPKGWGMEVNETIVNLLSRVSEFLLEVLDGGGSIINDNFTIANGGVSHTDIWGFNVNGGTSASHVESIDGGDSTSF